MTATTSKPASAQRLGPLGVAAHVGQRRVVALALDLDHQRQALVAEVDPADPVVAPHLDLAPQPRLAGPGEHLLEAPFEPAVGRDVAVAPLVEQGAQQAHAVAALRRQLVEGAAKRPRRQQAPPPHVVEHEGRPLGVLAAAQLKHGDLRPDHGHAVEHGHVVVAEPGDLVHDRPAPDRGR